MAPVVVVWLPELHVPNLASAGIPVAAVAWLPVPVAAVWLPVPVAAVRLPVAVAAACLPVAVVAPAAAQGPAWLPEHVLQGVAVVAALPEYGAGSCSPIQPCLRGENKSQQCLHSPPLLTPLCLV